MEENKKSTKNLKKYLKYIKVIVVTCIVIIVLSYISNGRLLAFTETGKNVNMYGDTLEGSLNGIGILETAEYYYTHIEMYDSSVEVVGFTVPFTNSKFIYSYDGTVTAGIDFSKIAITEDSTTIRVTLPEAEVQNSDIDTDSFKLYDETNNIFNPIGVQDVTDSFADMENAEIEKAVAKGLLDTANENAKTLIKNFINTAYPDSEREIIFE